MLLVLVWQYFAEQYAKNQIDDHRRYVEPIVESILLGQRVPYLQTALDASGDEAYPLQRTDDHNTTSRVEAEAATVLRVHYVRVCLLL